MVNGEWTSKVSVAGQVRLQQSKAASCAVHTFVSPTNNVHRHQPSTNITTHDGRKQNLSTATEQLTPKWGENRMKQGSWWMTRQRSITSTRQLGKLIFPQQMWTHIYTCLSKEHKILQNLMPLFFCEQLRRAPLTFPEPEPEPKAPNSRTAVISPR